MKKIWIISMFVFFAFGFLSCLLLAKKASKLWVAEEDLRRAFYYELKTVEMYKSGNVSAARDEFLSASGFTNDIAQRREWDFFAPLHLFILPEPSSRMSYNKCVLIFLDEMNGNREVLDSGGCRILGKAMLDGIGEGVTSNKN